MIWKKIKGYKNYILSEKGDLYNVKTDTFTKGSLSPSGVKYVSISKNGKTKQIQLAQLVLNVFKPSRTETKVHAYHNDLELINCANENLERCTRGDRKRMFARLAGKKRGVYKWRIDKLGNPRYRVVFKNKQGKTKTYGYYGTEFFAQFRYIQAYKKEFGMLPY